MSTSLLQRLGTPLFDPENVTICRCATTWT